jgi:hypothetical protein
MFKNVKLNFQQYLTKLKRLLPTFFEDFEPQQIEALLGNATIQAIEDWEGPMDETIVEEHSPDQKNSSKYN